VLRRFGLGCSFLTPDVAKYVDRMVAKNTAALFDLYTISFGEICDYLGELGQRLDLDKNPHWREAFEVSRHASNISTTGRAWSGHTVGRRPRTVGKEIGTFLEALQ
jgi:hypothetical protein